MKAVDMRLQFRMSQQLIRWRYTGFICGVSRPAHFTIKSLLSHEVARERKRKVRPWSDACWHHLHLPVNFSWHEASEESRETDGETGRESMYECKLFSHIIFGLCLHRHSAGVVRSSQNEARVMTMSGWHTATCPHRHTNQREHNATPDPPQYECGYLKDVSVTSKLKGDWYCI